MYGVGRTGREGRSSIRDDNGRTNERERTIFKFRKNVLYNFVSSPRKISLFFVARPFEFKRGARRVDDSLVYGIRS